MATASSTSITVGVQAKGGKFLADDIGGSEITIRDAQTGAWLGGGLALGTDSGNLSPLYSSNASLSAIVTPPAPPGGTWGIRVRTTFPCVPTLKRRRPRSYASRRTANVRASRIVRPKSPGEMACRSASISEREVPKTGRQGFR